MRIVSNTPVLHLLFIQEERKQSEKRCMWTREARGTGDREGGRERRRKKNSGIPEMQELDFLSKGQQRCIAEVGGLCLFLARWEGI